MNIDIRIICILIGIIFASPYWARLFIAARREKQPYKIFVFVIMCSITIAAFSVIGAYLQPIVLFFIQSDTETINKDQFVKETTSIILFVYWIKEYTGISVPVTLASGAWKYGNEFLYIFPIFFSLGPLLAYYNIPSDKRYFSLLRGTLAFVFCILLVDTTLYRVNTIGYSAAPCRLADLQLSNVLSDLSGGLIGGFLYAFLMHYTSTKLSITAFYNEFLDKKVNRVIVFVGAGFLGANVIYFLLLEYKSTAYIAGSFTWNAFQMNIRTPLKNNDPQILGTASLVTIEHRRGGAPLKPWKVSADKLAKLDPVTRLSIENKMRESEVYVQEADWTRISCFRGPENIPCQFRLHNIPLDIVSDNITEDLVENMKLKGLAGEKVSLPKYTIDEWANLLLEEVKEHVDHRKGVELKSLLVPSHYKMDFFYEKHQKPGHFIRYMGGSIFFIRSTDEAAWLLPLMSEFTKQVSPIVESDSSLITLVSNYSLRTTFNSRVGILFASPIPDLEVVNESVYGVTDDGRRVPIINMDDLFRIQMGGATINAALIIVEPVVPADTVFQHDFVNNVTAQLEVIDDLSVRNQIAHIKFHTPELAIYNNSVSAFVSDNVKGSLRVGKNAFNVDFNDTIAIQACGENFTADSQDQQVVSVTGRTNNVIFNGESISPGIWYLIPEQMWQWVSIIVFSVLSAVGALFIRQRVTSSRDS